jgi:hypothetical protein
MVLRHIFHGTAIFFLLPASNAPNSYSYFGRPNSSHLSCRKKNKTPQIMELRCAFLFHDKIVVLEKFLSQRN